MLTTIPDAGPLPLPAPPSLLWLLLMLTFFLHVLAMNFVLGGSIIAAVAHLRGKADELRWLGKAMPTMVAAAITFGVAPLLFLQALYGRLFFTSAVLMAWPWLAVVPLVIVAYYGTYAIAFRRAGTWMAVAIALILTGVAFIYSNNMTLMLRADRFLPLFLDSARGVQLNLGDATLVPRYLHMLFGAIAVAGLVIGLVGRARQGAAWFAGATMLNLITGAWWLGALPREVIVRFMGANAVASASLAVGTVAGIVALVLMVAAFTSASPRRRIVSCAIATGVTLLAMIVARDEVRRGMLERVGFTPATAIQPQWGAIGAFLVLFVLAVGATIWMALLLAKRTRPA